MYKKLFSLAIPNIISNITIPLVGMVDLTIVGLLADDIQLGGIAIGTAIFNLIYWNFGFLRMGTSGLTAQCYGRRDFAEATLILARALFLALAISAIIIVLQLPIQSATLWFMEGSQGVESAASQYFSIRIFAAPATLSLYAVKGWLIGMQNSRTPMWIAIAINIINVVVSYIFAITFGWGIKGVALGTLVAQWGGLILAVGLLARYYGRLLGSARRVSHWWRALLKGDQLRVFFVLNGDIFIRTLCLVSVSTYFIKASSSISDDVLSANTLLLQLFTLFSYFMDGFAYAGEALAGRYYGAGSGRLLRRSVRTIFVVGLGTAILFSLLYLFAGRYILEIFTQSRPILGVAFSYINWVALVPIVGFAAFLWDGIMVGMTQSRIMRNAMLVATALFFILYLITESVWGNDGLWFSFIVYLLLRGAVQWYLIRGKIAALSD